MRIITSHITEVTKSLTKFFCLNPLYNIKMSVSFKEITLVFGYFLRFDVAGVSCRWELNSNRTAGMVEPRSSVSKKKTALFHIIAC